MSNLYTAPQGTMQGPPGRPGIMPNAQLVASQNMTPQSPQMGMPQQMDPFMGLQSIFGQRPQPPGGPMWGGPQPPGKPGMMPNQKPGMPFMGLQDIYGQRPQPPGMPGSVGPAGKPGLTDPPQMGGMPSPGLTLNRAQAAGYNPDPRFAGTHGSGPGAMYSIGGRINPASYR